MVERADPVAFDEARTPWKAWMFCEVATRLAGIHARWAVAAGWAIDLHVGRATRAHHDIEIEMPAGDVPTVLAAFDSRWRWSVPASGMLHPLGSPAAETSHQTWLWSEDAGGFVLDVFRTPHDGDTWICRRDPTIRRPWREIVAVTADGVPYLVPEVVLLFKAKAARPKDVADLETVLPAMQTSQLDWLMFALERVHPGHAWLARLDARRQR